MKLSPTAALTASSPGAAAGATAGRPAPRGSLGGGLRPPSEASPQGSLRRQSRRSNLDHIACRSLRKPPPLPLLRLQAPLVRRQDAQLLAVASEGGFAPLPKPPPRNPCAGKAGARTSMISHEPVSGPAYRFFAGRRCLCESSTPGAAITSHEALSDSRPHRFFAWSRRWCDGRTPSSSRYFATVRRAIVSPCACRAWATSWSDSGVPGFSASTMSRIIFFTDTDDTMGPALEAMPLWKKNFSSNSPWGVWTYLLVVTRLMVDSCMLMSSPTSRSASGRRNASPLSRNSRWKFTRLCATRRRVRCRCSTLLMSHTADRIFCSTYCLASSPDRLRSER